MFESAVLSALGFDQCFLAKTANLQSLVSVCLLLFRNTVNETNMDFKIQFTKCKGRKSVLAVLHSVLHCIHSERMESAEGWDTSDSALQDIPEVENSEILHLFLALGRRVVRSSLIDDLQCLKVLDETADWTACLQTQQVAALHVLSNWHCSATLFLVVVDLCVYFHLMFSVILFKLSQLTLRSLQTLQLVVKVRGNLNIPWVS